MRTGTVSYKLEDLRKGVIIPIGMVGENDFTRVIFDAEEVFKKHPDAQVTMKVQPPKGGIYPATVTRDGNAVIWQVKAADVAHRGSGELQITFTADTMVEKSYIAKTDIKRSLVGNGHAPDPVQDWMDEAQEALEDIESAEVHQPIIGLDGYWYTWNQGTGEYEKTNTKAQGQDGHSPVLTSSKSGKTTTIFADGDQLAQILDGEDGQGADVIDDTAGEGDTDKTWSADKLDEELTDVKNEIESMTTATASDVGKALSPKTVNNGKVTEWKFVSVGGGGSVETDKTMTEEDVPADAKAVGDIVNDLTDLVPSKNLYDKNACNPQNGKQYNTYGVEADNDKYAITGKIPVEAGVQYIFSIGGLGKVKSAYYYGSDGNSLVGKETLDNAAFTTPTGTAFVGLTLFAATHTAEAYNSAIAVAQLEKGSVATNFVPYSLTRKVPSDRLVDGEAVEGAVNFTTKASLINLYDKTIAIDGKYINSQTHALTDNSSYSFSGLIPVKPNTQYCYSKDKSVSVGSLSSTVQEWDENGSFIRSGSFGTASTHINQVRTGATTKYISFNITYSESHTTQQFNDLIDTLMVCEGCQRPLEYSAYNEEPVVNHLKLDNMYQNNADRFRGKRWLVTGTSVSYQDSKEYTEGVADGELVRGYIGDIARRKPMLITNNAVSGSTLAGSDANSLINTYQNYTYTDFDFMTIEYGINDFGNNVLVGTASDAPGTGTFAACLKTVIEYVLTQNPIIGLIICTDPCVRDSTNNNGNTLKEYMDVMLEIAKQYRLPVCDWFYQSGINSITKGDGSSRNFLTQHGTHPSVYGHMRMGAMLNQVFDSLLC